MQAELEALDAALGNPERPVMAMVGGAKVSTKLELLGNLVGRVECAGDRRRDGQHVPRRAGALPSANRLQEADMHETARDILARAKPAGCDVVLPVDAVVARELQAEGRRRETVAIDAVPADAMILDVGPATVRALIGAPGRDARRWSGTARSARSRRRRSMPATVALAQAVAAATAGGQLRSVAGGGDTVSALRHAGVLDQLSYVSTAGGAFLEWMEGKTLPGVAALR